MGFTFYCYDVFSFVQVRRALESPLGSLYISKDHLSIGLSKDSWLRVVIFPMGMVFFKPVILYTLNLQTVYISLYHNMCDVDTS
jgi:hypothetical protein